MALRWWWTWGCLCHPWTQSLLGLVLHTASCQHWTGPKWPFFGQVQFRDASWKDLKPVNFMSDSCMSNSTQLHNLQDILPLEIPIRLEILNESGIIECDSFVCFIGWRFPRLAEVTYNMKEHLAAMLGCQIFFMVPYHNIHNMHIVNQHNDIIPIKTSE